MTLWYRMRMYEVDVVQARRERSTRGSPPHIPSITIAVAHPHGHSHPSTERVLQSIYRSRCGVTRFMPPYIVAPPLIS